MRFGSLVLVLEALCVSSSLPLRNFARFDAPPFVGHLAQMESPVSIDGLMHVGSLVFVYSFLRLDSLLLVYEISLSESSMVIVDFILCGSALLLRYSTLIGSSMAGFSRIQLGLFPFLLDFTHFESSPVRSFARLRSFLSCAGIV